MEYVWNRYGIRMEYICKMCGICMECEWNMKGYVWNTYGIRMQDVWNMYGICRNMYAIVWNICENGRNTSWLGCAGGLTPQLSNICLTDA